MLVASPCAVNDASPTWPAFWGPAVSRTLNVSRELGPGADAHPQTTATAITPQRPKVIMISPTLVTGDQTFRVCEISTRRQSGMRGVRGCNHRRGGATVEQAVRQRRNENQRPDH